MLITYPLPDYTSYIDSAEIKAFALKHTPSFGVVFGGLTQVEQDNLATEATLQIRICPSFKLEPKPAPMDVKLGQLYLMEHLFNNPMGDIDPNARAITSEKVGALAVTYDTALKFDALAFPQIVYNLLAPYGCSNSKGFSQSRIVKG